VRAYLRVWRDVDSDGVETGFGWVANEDCHVYGGRSARVRRRRERRYLGGCQALHGNRLVCVCWKARGDGGEYQETRAGAHSYHWVPLQKALFTTPPSTRSAAPVVADDNGLAT
jgi:hypothetical protein